jgi:diguanylate cyclase (GGDEF)-like protein
MGKVLSDPIDHGGLGADAARGKKAVNVGGLLMAAGTALLVCLSLLVCAFLDLLPWDIAIESTAGVAALVVAFHVLVRTGLNQRFSDPSLTTEQVAAAILFLAYIMYHAEMVRDALTLFYLVIMLYGALRLSAARLAGLAILALVAHGTMLHLTYLRDQEYMDFETALTEFAILMVTLPWFAAMGGYVNRLRTRLAESNRNLEQALERIRDIAVRDELTGAYNRRFLTESLARELARSGRSSGRFSVCLIDVDHFKAVNDRLGHAAGDEVLRQVAAIARRDLRQIDVFGRFGGEEFLLLLPDTDQAGATVVGERIRAAVAAETGVTVTIGVAQHAKDEAPATLLARADRALYRGKALGRNRVLAESS